MTKINFLFLLDVSHSYIFVLLLYGFCVLYFTLNAVFLLEESFIFISSNNPSVMDTIKCETNYTPLCKYTFNTFLRFVWSAFQSGDKMRHLWGHLMSVRVWMYRGENEVLLKEVENEDQEKGKAFGRSWDGNGGKEMRLSHSKHSYGDFFSVKLTLLFHFFRCFKDQASFWVNFSLIGAFGVPISA